MPTTQPFVHTPRAPQVPAAPEHSAQRYFCDASGKDREVYITKEDHSGSGTCRVLRFAETNTAQLTSKVNHGYCWASITVSLSATALRDLAQRLLDAAHDIETNPAAALMAAREAAEAVQA